MIRLFFALFSICSWAAAGALAGDWAYQGADPGMTKYSSDDIAAGQVQQVYQKRFYSKYSADINPAYNISTGVLIRGGQAWVISNDAADNGNWYSPIVATKFNWATGTTTLHSSLPGYGIGANSFHPNENNAEIDSNHFNFPALWAADGRVYARRGGDQRCLGAMNASTGAWTMLPSDGAATGSWAGDTAAFINSYGDKLLYYGGDTRDGWPYSAADISSSAWTNGTQGTYKFPVVNSAPSTGNGFYDGLRNGDIPKAAHNTAVIASWYTNPNTSAHTMYVTATNLTTGQTAWSKSYANDNAGATGFYTCTADYWRFVATEDGDYAYFVRNGGQTQLHVADITTGTDKFTRQLAANSSPLMAYNQGQGCLYVVSASEQMKLDASTGAVVWRTTRSYSSDAGYKPWEDPTYRPMVLTDDTLWFVNGSTASSGHLIEMRTSDGSVVQDVDLAQLVTSKNPNERLIAVNDLVAADGRLGVLVDVGDITDPNYNTTSKIKYQDLYVFSTTPEPCTLVAMILGTLFLNRRCRRAP